MSNTPGETPKLHIDSDWKSQAQAEKERLVKIEQEKRASTPPAGAGTMGAGAVGMTGGQMGAAGQRGGNELPEASFESLMGTLATQAIIYLGGARDPRTGQPMVDLDVAKLQIDLLGVLEAKTKGNLTEDEGRRLSTLLYELRMRFVSIARQVSALTAEAMGGGAAEAELGGGAGMSLVR